MEARDCMLIAVGLLILLLASAVAGGCMPLETPAEFKPGVVAGKGLLEKKRISGLPEIGGITDIVLRRPRAGADEAVIVAGTSGAVILEPKTYTVLTSVRLNDGEPPFIPHRVVDADGDGDVEFFRQPRATGSAELYDEDGRLLWKRSPPGRGFPEATFGDVDGDGRLDFLLWSSSDKIRLVDHEGKIKWDQRWDHGAKGHKMLDTDRDRKDEVLYTDGKALCIRDGNGTLLHREELKDANYVNALETVLYPNPTGRLCLCIGFNRKKFLKDPEQFYRIFELDGKTLVRDMTPVERSPYLQTKPVRFSASRPAHHARIAWWPFQGVIVGFSATRIVLRLHDSAGALLYEEVIMSSAGEVAKGHGALAVVPAGEAGNERLLVGYGPDLWEYKLKKP